MTVAIRPEAKQDRVAIWHTNQAAFQGDAEANLVDVLRERGIRCQPFRERRVVKLLLVN